MKAGLMMAGLRCFGLIAALAYAHSSFGENNLVIVPTRQGWVRGVARNAVIIFEGIPYAAPPIGNLRWKAPAPPPVRSATLDADHFGPNCFSQEDCLYLNIYKPAHALPSAALPILMWIHGGGLSNGSGAYFDGAVLAAENNIIVVTINYRLAALGFFAHPALTAENGSSGNYGILDQQAAMRWIKGNIEKFGGDPANITLMGQSAGGLSVSTQLASPLAAGLFAKAIVSSGAYIRQQPMLASAERNGEADAEKLKCAGADAETASCLRALSFDMIRKNTTGPSSGSWSPVIDNYVLTESTAVAFERGDFNRVPTIMGSTKDEQSLVAPHLPMAPLNTENYAGVAAMTIGPVTSEVDIASHYPSGRYASPTHAVVAAIGDFRFTCGMVADATHISKYVGQTWQYEFAEQNPAQVVPDGGANFPGKPPAFFGPWGDYHTSDVPYLFGQFAPEERTPTNLYLSSTIRAHLANFVRRGNPNGPGLSQWREVGAGESTAMLFATPIVPDTDTASRHQCDYWQAKPPSDRLF